MTFNEKETVISALSAYEKQQERTAAREEKRGEYGRCAAARAEAQKARALLFTFCDFLAVPCGEAKI